MARCLVWWALQEGLILKQQLNILCLQSTMFGWDGYVSWHTPQVFSFACQAAPCMQLSVGFFNFHINWSIKNQQGERREVRSLCGGCRKGKRVEMFPPTIRAVLSRKKPAISFVLERLHLHLVGGEGGGRKNRQEKCWLNQGKAWQRCGTAWCVSASTC